MGTARITRVSAELARAIHSTSAGYPVVLSMTNPDAEAGASTGWTTVGSSSLTRVSTHKYAGTYAFQLTGQQLAQAYQDVSVPFGNYADVDNWRCVLGVSAQIARDPTCYRTYGKMTSGTATITGIPTTEGIAVGMYVSGSSVPANAYVLSVDSSSQITISSNATGSNSADITIGWFLSGTFSSGAATITGMASTANLSVGMLAMAASYTPSTASIGYAQIASVDSGSQVTLTRNATGSGSATVYFVKHDSGCVGVQFLDNSGVALEPHIWRTDNIAEAGWGVWGASSTSTSQGDNTESCKFFTSSQGKFLVPKGTRTVRVYLETYSTDTTHFADHVYLDALSLSLDLFSLPMALFNGQDRQENYWWNTSQGYSVINIPNNHFQSGYVNACQYYGSSGETHVFNWLISSGNIKAASQDAINGINNGVAPPPDLHRIMTGYGNANYDVYQRFPVAHYYTAAVIDAGKAYLELAVWVKQYNNNDVADVELFFYNESGSTVGTSARYFAPPLKMVTGSNSNMCPIVDMVAIPASARWVEIHLRGVYVNGSNTFGGTAYCSIEYALVQMFPRVGSNYTLRGYKFSYETPTASPTFSNSLAYSTVTFSAPVKLVEVLYGCIYGNSSGAFDRALVYAADANGNPSPTTAIARSARRTWQSYNNTRMIRYVFDQPVVLAAGTYCIAIHSNGYVAQRGTGVLKTSYTMTGTTSTSSANITGISDTSGVFLGMFVSGTGIAANSFVASIASATQAGMNQNGSANGSAAITFSSSRAATVGITNGSATATMASTVGLYPGYGISGTGIPLNTIVLAIVNSTTLTLSANATATNASASLTFDIIPAWCGTSEGYTHVKSAYTSSNVLSNATESTDLSAQSVGGVFNTSHVNNLSPGRLPFLMIFQDTTPAYYNPIVVSVGRAKRRMFVVS